MFRAEHNVWTGEGWERGTTLTELTRGVYRDRIPPGKSVFYPRNLHGSISQEVDKRVGRHSARKGAPDEEEGARGFCLRWIVLAVFVFKHLRAVAAAAHSALEWCFIAETVYEYNTTLYDTSTMS